jgi:hypothetical protein
LSARFRNAPSYLSSVELVEAPWALGLVRRCLRDDYDDASG